MPSPNSQKSLPEHNNQCTVLVAPFHADTACIIADLHAQCFDSCWGQDDFRRFSASSAHLGLTAWREDRAAGLVLASCADAEAEILTLGVAREDRRTGVASALLRRLIAELSHRKIAELYLEVGVGNMAARQLYERLGFERAGLRPRYYPTPAGPEDALIMKFAIVDGCK